MQTVIVNSEEVNLTGKILLIFDSDGPLLPPARQRCQRECHRWQDVGRRSSKLLGVETIVDRELMEVVFRRHA